MDVQTCREATTVWVDPAEYAEKMLGMAKQFARYGEVGDAGVNIALGALLATDAFFPSATTREKIEFIENNLLRGRS